MFIFAPIAFNASSIDPISAAKDLYNFTLFSKAGNIERRLCIPSQLKLAFDPRVCSCSIAI